MTIPVGVTVGDDESWSLWLGDTVPPVTLVGEVVMLRLGIKVPTISVGATVPVCWSNCRQ